MAHELADLFAERHAYLACSLTALGHLESGAARDACVSDLTDVLAAHLRSVEHGTSSVLRQLGPSKTLDQVLGAYGGVGLALASTLVALKSIDQFSASLEALAVAVQSMCQVERHIVLPALEAILGFDERAHLVIEMQASFDQHVGVVGVDGFPPKAVSRSGMR
ncbi:hypothetical protein [Rhizobacter fulvus]|jgi:hypothetical protein